MKLSTAFEGGLVGAFVLSLLHELLKWKNPDAPHLDKLGEEALVKALRLNDLPIPGDKKLFLITLAGDLLVNSAFYAAAGVGSHERVWLRGVLLGLSAGVGGVLLPKPLGLDDEPTNKSTTTKILTLGLYMAGGLVASAVMDYLQKRQSR